MLTYAQYNIILDLHCINYVHTHKINHNSGVNQHPCPCYRIKISKQVDKYIFFTADKVGLTLSGTFKSLVVNDASALFRYGKIM